MSVYIITSFPITKSARFEFPTTNPTTFQSRELALQSIIEDWSQADVGEDWNMGDMISTGWELEENDLKQTIFRNFDCDTLYIIAEINLA